MQEQAPQERLLTGSIPFKIVLGEDVDTHWEQSNENNFVAFTAVEKTLEELYDRQLQPGSPESKMDKDELKELQIARQHLKKHIAMLGVFVKNKYKDAIFTKDKPKIEIINPLTNPGAIPPNLKG